MKELLGILEISQSKLHQIIANLIDTQKGLLKNVQDGTLEAEKLTQQKC